MGASNEHRQDLLVERFRRFNRIYTPVIGTLDKGYLETPYSIQEARVIYEVAMDPGVTAKVIRERTGFDQGYLSRLVSRLERADLLEKRRSQTDGRARRLHLSKKGEQAFSVLDERADRQAQVLFRSLGPKRRDKLVRALIAIEEALDSRSDPPRIVIREERVGDLGWIFHRQSVFYQAEFGFTSVFETYVSKGLAPYLENKDPDKDRLWVAEADGRPVGAVAIQHVHDRPGWAQLRWFYVEQEARGKGLGRRLIEQAIRFSREAGYHGIFLWTVSTLEAARRVYEKAGFRLVFEDPGPCPWAQWAHEQKWGLELKP